MKRLLPLNHEYSVNSGVFTGISDKVSMRLDEYGHYKYYTSGPISDRLLSQLNKVDIMSDYSDNEDVLGKRLFGNYEGIHHDQIIGYYLDLYAGYVEEGDFRKNATSGGFGTWLLTELLETGEIDGVIHVHAVDPKENDGILFKYQISRTKAAIKQGSKARYYPVELSEVLAEVKQIPGRYAVVGISEFITEIRLLCEQDEVFKERIVYTIGLFNAHQKTTKYAEALAWQYGIQPGDLKSIDFRVKNPHNMAWNYQCSITGLRGGEEVAITEDMTNFHIHAWNMGFFKKRFSDFTDNAFNELADITLGDAWLHEYAQDYRGTNILIVRNPKIAAIIKNAIKTHRVKLDALGEDKIIASQGMLSHIIYELPYRLYKNQKDAKHVPMKRTKPAKNIPFLRQRVQDLREIVVKKNDRVYRRAVMTGDFSVYENFVKKYNKMNDQLYKLMERRGKITARRVARKVRSYAPFLPSYSELEVVKRKAALLSRANKRKLSRNRGDDGAIVTLCDDFNYGNVMQRYALQQFLQKQGLKFTQLSVYTGYLQSIRDEFLMNSLAPFVEKNIKSAHISNVDHKGYRNYIVGSDQVWRNHGTDNLERDYLPYWFNFLEGEDVTRISYAASFGVDNLQDAQIDEPIIRKIRPLLRSFAAVSVREKSGEQLVSEIAGKEMNPATVLDPTLLLKKSDYSELVDNSDMKNQPVAKVFSYVLDITENKTKVVKNIAQSYDGSYKIVSADPKKQLASTEEWLKSFRDAEYVATDSFHGAVFSIINQTDFVVIANRERGLARIENLLDLTGISKDRLIFPDSVDSFDRKQINPINWKDVNLRLEKLRMDSAEWLLNTING